MDLTKSSYEIEFPQGRARLNINTFDETLDHDAICEALIGDLVLATRHKREQFRTKRTHHRKYNPGELEDLEHRGY